jgi:hypothetical protein
MTRTPIFSVMPSAWHHACCAMLSSRATASRARMNTWRSSIPYWPSRGKASTIAGPPVLKENSRCPASACPARSRPPSRRVKRHRTAPGRSRAKS